ncbi:DNA topoisomerase I [Candidatus Collierbacteria bacterium RIFCSPHIGHO2_02_FULL_49_10]|uniref:DNA topoisomerase 1 n=2 Tax=Patescibacteria group TaxID=1783273 RepID=A0A1F4XSP0_9BACT|nr:MAG: DNA topoisomerase I [Candidatus Adlerbacteria bacterium RIFCSPHIGHO2_12_FULL_53_18]OGD70226.1 MAG: DNA topoisomerase I [Candidatus Collierbacteria bacterium RIFCSPHIGHO2_02_FULL_49_10]
MKLVIVESPAKAKTIEKYLSDIDKSGDFVVRASVGHVRDLPKSNKKAIDIAGGFVPHYEVVAGKLDVINDLKKLAKKADEVILATDPDREGEAIAWHIKEELGLKKPERIVFNEITPEAIAEALQNPRNIDDNLRYAQEARRVLDRLVGYDLSGLIWKKVRYGLSAGRVQSPALRILMEREREIRAFKPETFYVITAQTETPKKVDLTLTCVEEPRDKNVTDSIIDAVKKDGLTVAEVTESEMKRSPRPPFTTSTLQQAASTRLGFSPANTMRIAQKLYEAGHISYMRTDSVNLSKQAVDSIAKIVEKKFGKEYAQTRIYTAKSKHAQEAHEAIRPSHIEKENAGNTPEQKKLYELIWHRTAASQMADAKLLKTKIVAETKDKKVPQFAANGSQVVFDGWLKGDPAARGEDVELPKVTSGEELDVKSVEAEEKQTTPPPRYSEAGLVKELEKRGIGRPSTYASIMKTLVDRGYVTKEGRTLTPTDTGDVVSSFLEENFPTYISDTFTAEMEDELDEIAEGKREYAKTLKDFYTPFLKDVKIKDKEAGKITDIGEAPKEFPCPECGSPMVFKLSRGGKFMSCNRFPECTGSRTETGEIISNEPPKPIGNWPETGESIYVLTGRFGPYVQVGETPTGKGSKSKNKPRRASVPKEKLPEDVTLKDALHYLSLPRTLGTHPETGESIVANVGRFGPYIAHNTKPKPDFRSLKTDDVYSIDLPRALEILKEEKKKRGFARKTKKE